MTLRVMAAVVALHWRRLCRDPMGLVFTFIAPIAVTSVMIGIYTSQSPEDGIAVGVVAEAESAVADDLVRRLEDNSVLRIERYESRAGLERAVRRRDVGGGVVIPASVEDGAGRVELVGPPEIEAPSGVRAAVEAAVAETAAAVQLGQSLTPDASTEAAMVSGQLALNESAGSADRDVSGEGWWDGMTEAAIIGTLVLFVLMNTMGASGVVAELRELGILARARTTGATPLAMALGIGMSLMSYALLQAVLMLTTGWLAFGATWASWSGVLMVVFVLALVGGGLGVVTGSLLPSAESGTTIAGPIAFVLGMLGGCMWPLEIVGPTLDRLGHLTPHAWAVEAFQITGIGGGGIDDVAKQLAVLVAAAVLLLLLGGRRIARIAAQA